MTTDACMTTGFLGCFHYAYFNFLQALRKRKQAIYQTDDDDD